MKILKGHTSRVNDLAFSPDGRFLVSSSTDGTLRLWDTLSGEGDVLGKVADGGSLNSPAPGRPRAEFGTVAFTADGKYVLAQPLRGEPLVYDVAKRGLSSRTMRPPTNDNYYCTLAVAPGGDRAVVHEVAHRYLTSHVLRLWDVRTWADSILYRAEGVHAYGSLCFDPAGGRVAAGFGTFDVTSGEHVQRNFGAVVLSWPFAELIAAIRQNAICFSDAQTGARLREVRLEKKQVQDFAVSPDRAHLVVVSNEEVVRIWETRGWGERPGFAWQIGKLKCIAFAPDGLRAACGSQRGTILIWDWDL
jgi:WD40 repeat protein